jgi:hypothetical protein
MKMQTKTLLAGVAALALMAGTGLASAQEQNAGKQPQASSPSMKSSAAPKAQGQSGASHMGQNTQPSGHKMGMEQTSPRGKSAQQQTKGTERFGQSTSPKGEASTMKGRHAQQINRGNKGNLERNGTAQTEQKGGMTNRGTRSSGTTVSEQRNGRNGLKGLQGNASHVTLNDEQRTKIRQTVISAHGAPRVSHVDFDLAVGTVVPRGSIHFVPVPRLLVDIEPAWRGYDYFIYEDELVIIDPRNMTIIAVVPV